MPELPDVVVYIEALERCVLGECLENVRVVSPFVLRTFDPPIEAASGRTVVGLRRLGKRIVISLEDDLHVVIHLMIAGRLRWRKPGASVRGRSVLAAFDFAAGTVLFTEASPKKRASIHVVAGAAALAALDPGGLEVLDGDLENFATALVRENHTLKRTLTDPRILSGIGNAYSDEILHRARLSPLRWSQRLEPHEIERLFRASREVLNEWTERLRRETGAGFPEKVTAFREGMAAHGRFREPCPECGAPIQRIVYAQNETHYCPGCQTGGKLLADRALSRLLKKDWPRSLEELDQMLDGLRET